MCEGHSGTSFDYRVGWVAPRLDSRGRSQQGTLAYSPIQKLRSCSLCLPQVVPLFRPMLDVAISWIWELPVAVEAQRLPIVTAPRSRHLPPRASNRVSHSGLHPNSLRYCQRRLNKGPARARKTSDESPSESLDMIIWEADACRCLHMSYNQYCAQLGHM